MKTIFVLGQNSELSNTEITAVLGSDLEIAHISNQILISASKLSNPGAIQARLGGTVKVASVQATVGIDELDAISPFLTSLIDQANGRIQYGISVYDAGNKALYHKLVKATPKIGLGVKKELKEQGESIRFVTSKVPALSSVIVKTNNLINSGGEFILVTLKDKIVIGKTEAVQNFQDWAKRDTQKPKRDPKRGMLPPKLARIMLNLALGNKEDEQTTLLDPFCGVGTVLMEGLMLEIRKVIGSDIDQVATDDSEENLRWFASEYEIESTDVKLVTSAAEHLNEYLEPETVTHVVTEPNLGPPQKGRLSETELKSIIKDLTKLYEKSFKTIANLLCPGGTIVVAFPVFEYNRKKLYVRVSKTLAKYGLEVQPFDTKQKTPQGGILYERSGQFVAREILRFVKQKM